MRSVRSLCFFCVLLFGVYDTLMYLGCMKRGRISDEKLTVLRKELPKGAIGAIAEKLSLSASFVQKVLTGKRYSLDVIEEAIKLRDKEVARLKKLEDAI